MAAQAEGVWLHPQAEPPQKPSNPFVWQGMSEPEPEQLMQDLLGALNTMSVILGGGGGLVEVMAACMRSQGKGICI